jgi:hypothetical protein
MKMDIIKWDKSMETRCLAIFGETEVKAATGTVSDEIGSSYDKQWVEFERALDKALKN